jgi:hypothetical protein
VTDEQHAETTPDEKSTAQIGRASPERWGLDLLDPLVSAERCVVPGKEHQGPARHCLHMPDAPDEEGVVAAVGRGENVGSKRTNRPFEHRRPAAKGKTGSNGGRFHGSASYDIACLLALPIAPMTLAVPNRQDEGYVALCAMPNEVG